jgi:hypothetical protein
MYLLDSNVFIQAKNRHYDFDFCPAFWDWLLLENEKRNVFSIDKVKDEIITGDDELTNWVKNNTSDQFFLPTNIQTTAEFHDKVSHHHPCHDLLHVLVLLPPKYYHPTLSKPCLLLWCWQLKPLWVF